MAHFEDEKINFPVIDSDFSELEGTCCYCSDGSAAQIRDAIASLPLSAIHLIGTGDYHYISLFWLERIAEPFELLLFDNHPDDQPTAFGTDILSCGSWVAGARSLPFCRATRWIRSLEDLSDCNPDHPVYISIDLDILSTDFARTDWDQGDMTLDGLCEALAGLSASCRIIGADICGGITEAQGGRDADLELNRNTTNRITSYIK